MQDPANELPRIPLLSTRVNRVKPCVHRQFIGVRYRRGARESSMVNNDLGTPTLNRGDGVATSSPTASPSPPAAMSEEECLSAGEPRSYPARMATGMATDVQARVANTL